MSSFDEWYNENLWNIENYYDAEISFEAGAQSRQAEIALLQEQVDELHLKLKSNEHSGGEFISAISLACGEYLKESDELKKRIDELRSRLKAINEYQDIIFKELQFFNPNFELVFNKLEDIDDLSKGDQP